jgi:hypothetical protein
VFPGWSLGEVLVFWISATALLMATLAIAASRERGTWSEGDAGVEKLVCDTGEDALHEWRTHVLVAVPVANVWTWNQTQALLRLSQKTLSVKEDREERRYWCKTTVQVDCLRTMAAVKAEVDRIKADLVDSTVASALPSDLWGVSPNLDTHICWRRDRVPGEPCLLWDTFCGSHDGYTGTATTVALVLTGLALIIVCMMPLILTAIMWCVSRSATTLEVALEQRQNKES